MRPTNVLVWAVYPPTAGWRGEGITQTLENILLNAPKSVHYTLVLSAAHLPIARETLGDSENIRLVPFGLNLRSLKIWTDPARLLKETGPAEDFSSKLGYFSDKIIDALLALIYFCSSPVSKFLVSKVIKRSDVIYNPSPVYSLLSYKKIPKVFNFWDPFVFEYSAFGNVRRRELHRFMFKYFLKAKEIVTQSKANEQYLKNIWNFSAGSVNVIYNGSPNYRDLYKKFQDEIGVKLTLKNILDFWPRKRIAGFTKAEALSVLLSETLNSSMLFRLTNASSPETKIIMISTQYRPYKGFEALFDVLDALIKAAPQFDFRFVITAELPEKVRERFSGKYSWETERVYEMTRLSNIQHACMYSVSDIVLHPSFAEGGPTPYPASEAASLGIPSLTNLGRHTIEMLERDGGGLACTVADFLKKDQTVQQILNLLTDQKLREENVLNIENARVDWAKIGSEYAKVFEKYSTQ